MNGRHAVIAVISVGMGVAASLNVGCEPQNKLNVTVEEGAQAVRVNLPSVPTLPPPPHPVHLPGADNPYTVYGVRHEAARNWTKQVTVRGHIVDVYVPMAPNARPPRVCRPNECTEERPHIFIADTPNEQDPERRLQVTGYATFQADIDDARIAAARARPAANPAQPNALQQAGLTRAVPTDFYPGAEVTVTGTFTRRASNGQADSNGVIEYARHTTNTPAPDAGAPPRR